MERGWIKPTGNIGVITALDYPCLQARTHILTPGNGPVTRRPNILSHACMYAFMYVDIHTHNRQGMCRNKIWQACMSIETCKAAKVKKINK